MTTPTPFIVGVIVHGKEWFDRSAGNSYCAVRVTVWNTEAMEEVLYAPFQYGYGNFYEQLGLELLRDHDVLWGDPAEYISTLWQLCEARGVRLYRVLETGCTRKDIERWGTNPEGDE